MKYQVILLIPVDLKYHKPIVLSGGYEIDQNMFEWGEKLFVTSDSPL